MASSFRNMRQAAGKVGERLNDVMAKHPIAANSFVCFNLWVAGDLLAQHYEHQNQRSRKKDENDTPSTTTTTTNNSNNDAPVIQWKRTAQAASYGAIVSGPLYAVWFPWLDRQFTTTWNVAARFAWSPARAAWAIPALKVAADQFLLDPPTIALFFVYMEYCQSTNDDDDDDDHVVDASSLIQKIREELPVAWLTSLCTWPAVLLPMFRFVPLVWQPAVVNTCAIAWDAFLSHRNALAKEKRQQQSLKQRQQQQQECHTNDSSTTRRTMTTQQRHATKGTTITVRRATTARQSTKETSS